MFETRKLTKTYAPDIRALIEVDLQIDRGETVALVGESGSGKSTLLRCFNRLVRPTTGTLLIDGKPAAEFDAIELRRSTGYVQQDGGLLPHWTVAANVGLVPYLSGWNADRRAGRAVELLELVGLSPARYASRYPRELSGGERQRVAFARALAADPDSILLDEPFGALDALTRRELQNQFLELKRVLHKTLVLVTHDLTEAFRLADRIAVMRAGRLLQIAAPEDLLAAPADDYVASLLARAGATP